jgi:hypothetical protein
VKLGEVLCDHGNCGLLSKLARVSPPPPPEAVPSVVVTETVEEASASVVVFCDHCKKLVPPGEEGNHFRLKQRVNARPGVMDKKWYCHASPSPKPVAPPPKPKPVAASTSTKVGTWFRRGDLWDCPCHMIDISFRDATCPSGCGGIRPPL